MVRTPTVLQEFDVSEEPIHENGECKLEQNKKSICYVHIELQSFHSIASHPLPFPK